MESVLAQLSQYGVWVVGVNVLLQQLGLPIPSVPTMMVAGALASMGNINGPAAFALSVCASLAADLLWFAAGRRFGYPVLRFLCKVSLSPDMCVRQTEGIFERWGFYSVVLSKFVPGFSTVAPPIAGALRMRASSFTMASIASASLWVGVAMGTGYLFASQIELVLAWMAAHLGIAGLGVAAVVAAYVLFKAWQRWRLARFVNAALIGIDDLRTALDGGEPRPFLVDIGSRLAQQSRPHIPGAALLDLEAIARLDDFPSDRDIVVYCACPNEASAKRAAQILLGRGYTRVRPLRGGLDAWMRAGHPVERGATVRFAPRPSRTEEKSAA
jgi:membrane protein DedA with SNARE-associated domain/rhodanese-related sulfurtransferase